MRTAKGTNVARERRLVDLAPRAPMGHVERVCLRERIRVDQERTDLGTSLSTRWLDTTAMNRIEQFNHRIRGFWGW